MNLCRTPPPPPPVINICDWGPKAQIAEKNKNIEPEQNFTSS